MTDDPSLPVWLRQQIHADRDRHQAGWYGDTHWKALRRRAHLGSWTVSRRNGVPAALNDEITDAGLGELRKLFDDWQADRAEQFIADLDAKLAIVDAHTGEDHFCPSDLVGYSVQAWHDDADPCPTLRLLAVPYADRPGFQLRWRIDA